MLNIAFLPGQSKFRMMNGMVYICLRICLGSSLVRIQCICVILIAHILSINCLLNMACNILHHNNLGYRGKIHRSILYNTVLLHQHIACMFYGMECRKHNHTSIHRRIFGNHHSHRIFDSVLYRMYYLPKAGGSIKERSSYQNELYRLYIFFILDIYQ